MGLRAPTAMPLASSHGDAVGLREAALSGRCDIHYFSNESRSEGAAYK